VVQPRQGTFIDSLKQDWRALSDSPPGRRFQHRYEKKRRGGRSRGRTLKLSAAIALIVVGIVLLVIPGPGSVLIVIGAALLAEESSRVARSLDLIEMRIRRLLGRE
jgi:Flp pilus assembly protein TadB